MRVALTRWSQRAGGGNEVLVGAEGFSHGRREPSTCRGSLPDTTRDVSALPQVPALQMRGLLAVPCRCAQRGEEATALHAQLPASHPKIGPV